MVFSFSMVFLVLPVVGVPSLWPPMFRILPYNGRVMKRRGVVEIETHRWRGEQHVNRDAWGRGSRHPGTTILIYIVPAVAVVIDLIIGVIHVVVLHH
jgi:hypothetical protein